jgi:hypothetical protein
MNSILLAILPTDVENIPERIDELLEPYVTRKEYFFQSYIDQITKQNQLTDESFYQIIDILEDDLKVGLQSPIRCVYYDEIGVFKEIAKYPNFTPGYWKIGGMWDGAITKSAPVIEGKVDYYVYQQRLKDYISNNTVKVSELDKDFLGAVYHIILPDEKLICYWDYDYQSVGSDIFGQQTHLIQDLQVEKERVVKEYPDYIAVAVDVIT